MFAPAEGSTTDCVPAFTVFFTADVIAALKYRQLFSTGGINCQPCALIAKIILKEAVYTRHGVFRLLADRVPGKPVISI
jgi:hypothetical protein